MSTAALFCLVLAGVTSRSPLLVRLSDGRPSKRLSILILLIRIGLPIFSLITGAMAASAVELIQMGSWPPVIVRLSLFPSLRFNG